MVRGRNWYVLLSLFLISGFNPLVCWAKGPVQVRGYFRRDGSYVAPHTRAAPGTGSSSAGASVSGNWTLPKFPASKSARSGYRTTAREFPRTAAAGTRSEDPEEPVPTFSSRRAPAEKSDKETAAERELQERLAAKKIAHEQELAAAAAELAQQEDETKAASRLKRIKQLIAEKKGVISRNMQDSLREVIKKYPTTAAAKEAAELLAE